MTRFFWLRVLIAVAVLNAVASLVLMGVRIDQEDGWRVLWNVGNLVVSVVAAVVFYRTLRQEQRR